jgi:hypothetical protein
MPLDELDVIEIDSIHPLRQFEEIFWEATFAIPDQEIPVILEDEA